MPISSPKPCNKPGCGQLTRSRFCDKHKKRTAGTAIHHGRRKASPAARGYDWTWQKLSKRFRKSHPLCERCKEVGKLKPVDIVDHVVPISEDWSRRLDETNLMSLCHQHHREKTAKDDRRRNAAIPAGGPDDAA